jgi:glycosyltransferase involved in cell wall biosynthesis
MNMPRKPQDKQGKKLYYVISLFPVVTQTFVSREIKELERRGLRMGIVSLRNDPQRVGDEEMPAAQVEYIPYFFSIRLLSGVLKSLARHPWRILSSIFYIAFKLGRRPGRVMKFAAIVPKTLYLMDRCRDVDSCHVHAHWATVPATCAFFMNRVTGVRFSFSAHAWDIFVEGNELLLPEKLEAADAVFTCTEYNQSYLRQMCVHKEKVRLMYHGLELSRYPYEEPGNEEVLIAAGGSLIPQKGLDVLLRALMILDRGGHSFKAVIFGRGPEKSRLLRLHRELSLGDTVEFRDAMPHEEVIRLLQRADVFVMPSISAKKRFVDGLPNVLGEAMACGAAVVASRISGIPELIEDGLTGLLVEPNDADALAAALARVMKDEELMKNLAAEARKRVEEKFDIRMNIEPIADYFRALGFDLEVRD